LVGEYIFPARSATSRANRFERDHTCKNHIMSTARTLIQARTHIHARTHARTHTRTHAYIHMSTAFSVDVRREQKSEKQRQHCLFAAAVLTLSWWSLWMVPGQSSRGETAFQPSYGKLTRQACTQSIRSPPGSRANLHGSVRGRQSCCDRAAQRGDSSPVFPRMTLSNAAAATNCTWNWVCPSGGGGCCG